MGIFSSPKNKKGVSDFSKTKKIYTSLEQKKILEKMSSSDKSKIKDYLKSLGKGKSVGSISDKIGGEYGAAIKKKFFKAAKNYYAPPQKGLTDKQKRLNIYFGQISAGRTDEYMKNPSGRGVGRNVSGKTVRSEKYNQLGDIMNKPIDDGNKKFATMGVKSSVSIKGGHKEFSSLSNKGNRPGSAISSGPSNSPKPASAPPPIPLSR
jgi:hypothetical protein